MLPIVELSDADQSIRISPVSHSAQSQAALPADLGEQDVTRTTIPPPPRHCADAAQEHRPSAPRRRVFQFTDTSSASGLAIGSTINQASATLYSPEDTAPFRALTPAIISNICSICKQEKRSYKSFESRTKSLRKEVPDDTCLRCWQKLRREENEESQRKKREVIGVSSSMEQRNITADYAFGGMAKWNQWATKIKTEGSAKESAADRPVAESVESLGVKDMERE
jgi:hypothetical protein